MTGRAGLLDELSTLLRADSISEGIDTPGRARLARAVIATVVVVANVVGAAMVLALTLVVIPLPEVDDVSPFSYVLAAAAYVVVAVAIGVVVGIRGQQEIIAWLATGGPASPAVRASILGMPLRLFRLQLTLWLGGAVAFGTFVATLGAERGLWVGLIVALTGLTTASLAYLLVERLTRQVAARAMVGAEPSDLEGGRGVAVRGVLAWALGSGIPVAGLLILAVRTLLPSEVTRTELAVATVVLTGTSLVVGLRSVTLAARATADPVVGVAAAMARVHRGDLAARVPVYDGTEIGRLQLGFNEMVSGLEERERIRAAFGTYVDPAIAEHVLREGTDLAGEELELSMLFVDIRNFTGFAEQTTAPEVVSTINRLFERAVPAIREHGGHVDKFVGDGLLAVFGAPRRLDNHADAAVAAALAIADAAEAEFAGSLSIGIGVNTGTVVAGNVGGAGRFEFSVIGDPVNVAARIESATRQTGDTILVSARTCDLLDATDMQVVERPAIELKGKSGAVSLFAITRSA
ncbi:adenylate/guanylate cyclase domain-containing protein [Nocardioides humilatus]|uniref:Adenylate/guanylate cyclase domain-containing protein n=1 Tax=Nocardioides humilatus TaxID=2607660 RepID=A0A5B1LAV7_9ACTN|nr:adenylate/guanylate cyclase domain-containing protein [Nocardioides humilatus]KAA1416910.1 adenylate/guanylate cyclase domain-containing protein [Nocardioides humilatus]